MRLFDRTVGDLFSRGVGLWPARRPAPGAADPELPVGEAAYVVVDTELTGLNPRTDSIVSVGALRMDGGRIVVGSQFSRIVRPRTEITASSVLIHGITPGETRESPGADRVLPELQEFCRGRILVGHAVSIDLSFVNAEAERLGLPPFDCPAVDTMQLRGFLCRRTGDHCAFRERDPGPMDLFTLAREHDIPVSRAHDALYDAYVTAQLFQHYLAALPAHGVRTVGELLEIGQP